MLLFLSFIFACAPYVPSEKEIQAQKAQEAANSISFAENAEIENIKHRLELTSKPGLIGYVVLLNEMGSPILYTTLKGKITSGSKRLTSPDMVRSYGQGTEVLTSPSDEGTYGSSNPYIFFWTQNGTYIQWSGHYLYSDQPIRLSTPTLVVDSE